MSLTPEQKEIRQSGIGASEASALVEVNPYKTPIDVWLTKMGKHVEDEEESNRQATGSALEPGLCKLYEERTGFVVWRPQQTYRHPEHPRVLASPDGLIMGMGTGSDWLHGLEIKCVGYRMRDHWQEDTVPAYVDIQCRQNMAVFDLDRWDVIALVDNEIHIYRIDRDPEMEAAIIEASEWFWSEYVEKREPPPVDDPEQRRLYLRHKYPGSVMGILREDKSEDVATAAQWLKECNLRLKELHAFKEELTNMLIERVGDGGGIKGPFGKFQMNRMPGAVSYKEVALELAGGVLPTDVIERHRGEPYRTPGFYPFTPKHLRGKTK